MLPRLTPACPIDRSQIPVEVANLAYLTSNVADRLDHLVVNMQRNSNASKVIGEMPAVFELCDKLRAANGMEAMKIHKKLEEKLEDLGRGLFKGKVDEQNLAREAKGEAEWVAGVAGVLGRPRWHHK